MVNGNTNRRLTFQVIGLIDVFTPSPTLESFSEVYLVNQLMSSDLNKIIKSQRLSDDHVRFLVYQMLRGLKYIHSAGVIHRVGNLYLHSVPLQQTFPNFSFI